MVVDTGNTWVLSVLSTAPIPWSMVISVAPNTSHSRVEISPGDIMEGLASKDSMLGNCQLAPVAELPPLSEGASIMISPVSGFMVILSHERQGIHKAVINSNARTLALNAFILLRTINLYKRIAAILNCELFEVNPLFISAC